MSFFFLLEKGKHTSFVCLALANLSPLVVSFSLSELHKTQPVAAQPLCPGAERRDGQEFVVDAEPGGREEWQVPAAQSSIHGQQQQDHQEQRKSREKKGNTNEVIPLESLHKVLFFFYQ